MLTLIEHGEIHAPEPLGRRSILLVNGKIGRIGEGAVMIFDGRVSHSNAADVGEEEILAVTDGTLHVLHVPPEGYGFNLETMRPVLPDQKELPEEVSLHK